ncbi:MAG: D-amino-acid transaminase [Neomegalonema sp.]|nr:D-amino-acid transaminase [Neomegalonema sp.]
MTDLATALAGQGIVYLDGAYMPAAEARVSPFDRAYLFGDGVYEVVTVLDRKLIDFPAHITRLERSLAALSLRKPIADASLLEMMRRLVRENDLTEGLIYMQISRGVAPRSFDWPEGAAPVLFAFAVNKPCLDTPASRNGVSVMFGEDRRWKRRDIKTINLLPASWAKAEAAEQGADDVWMVERGPDGRDYVTEGSSNNAWIVDADGRVITRALSTDILHGVTRATALAAAKADGITLVERAFTPAEAQAAAEAFVTSASAFVLPVVKIDGKIIGDGAPGPVTKKIRALYLEAARRSAM